jgi:hypothetical protein
MRYDNAFASVMVPGDAKSCAQVSPFTQNPCRSIGLWPFLG